MTAFILILHMASGAEPAWSYRDPAECWAAVEQVRTEYGIVAECRTATIATPVGAPVTSPRPLPKPEGLK